MYVYKGILQNLVKATKESTCEYGQLFRNLDNKEDEELIGRAVCGQSAEMNHKSRRGVQSDLNDYSP